MRYKVELRYGSASFDESQKDRALELYAQEGLRLRLCQDLHDEGVVVSGPPATVDLGTKSWVQA